MTQREPDFREFPSEAEWLRLPAPDISTDFVARTLLRLDAERRATMEPGLAEARESEPDEAESVGWAAALQHYEAPTPSADFVTRTVSRIQQQQRSRWSSLLSRYVVPPVTPEFVERTLQALRVEAGGGRVFAHPASARRFAALPWLLAAALLAVTLWFAGLFAPPRVAPTPEGPRPRLVQLTSDSPLPTVLAQLAVERDPDELPYASTSGLALLTIDNAAPRRIR